jgi:hypothetical protein
VHVSWLVDGKVSTGASMGRGAMERQGVGPRNGPREWDNAEAEAHR